MRIFTNFAPVKILENNTSRIFDLFFCFVFMPMLVFLGGAHYWITEWPLFFSIVCAYFYGCYFVIKHLNVPGLLINRRYVSIAVSAMVFVLFTWLLTLYPHPEVDFYIPVMSKYQTEMRDYGVSLSLWLMMSLVAAYSLTVSFVRELYGQILRQKQIENQKNNAELAMFKAQISPHFLFNTLNTLYSLVIGTSQKAEDAFIKFTEIMKYTYTTIGNEMVPLSDEVNYIQNYIDLQMLRLNRHTTIRWTHDVDDGGVMVPPMIMLTFVENAFKYGASTSRDCVVEIGLELRDGNLSFNTCNNVMKHSDEFRTEMPVGIDNCRARLANLFPGRYSLETREDGGVFTVNLEIQLI